MRGLFDRFAMACSRALGTAWAFTLAVLVVLIWACLGPIAHFSGDWQLTINTGTTIITFWMVFVIQNTVNTDTRALHLKLDELLRAVEGARTSLVALEHQPQDHLEAAQREVHEAVASESIAGQEDAWPSES